MLTGAAKAEEGCNRIHSSPVLGQLNCSRLPWPAQRHTSQQSECFWSTLKTGVIGNSSRPMQYLDGVPTVDVAQRHGEYGTIRETIIVSLNWRASAYLTPLKPTVRTWRGRAASDGARKGPRDQKRYAFITMRHAAMAERRNSPARCHNQSATARFRSPPTLVSHPTVAPLLSQEHLPLL